MTILTYHDYEPATGDYQSRLIISDRFIRFDDGADSGDFALYDHQNKTVYSVSHDAKSIFVMTPEAVPVSSEGVVDIQVERSELSDAPRIGGQPVTQFDLYAEGKRCLSQSAVKGFLQSELALLSAYQTLLAHSALYSLKSVPSEIKTPCYLVQNIYALAQQNDYGFPISLQRGDGYRRILEGLSQGVSVDSALFTLPEYEQFGLPDR